MSIPVLGCALLALACLAPPAPAQTTRDVADALIRRIRLEHFDGTRYGDLASTCRVLDLLGRSPRRYTEMDGPFFRRAAEWAASAASADPDADAWRVLALAGAVSGRLGAAREAALRRVAASDRLSEPALRALATFGRRPATLAADEWTGLDPEVAVHLARDAGAVPAPPLQPRRSWAAWARGLRLRGAIPDALPDLPDPQAAEGLDALLDDLEVVLVLHGLPAPDRIPPAADAAHPRPDRVPAGRPAEDALELAWSYLHAAQDEGTFGLGLPFWDGPQAGVTALDLSAVIWLAERLGRPRPAFVDAGLDHLVSLQRPDGSITDAGPAVYTTSVAIDALLDGGRPDDLPAVERARRYLLAVQADEGEGYTAEDDPLYGGIGYGGDERPDLSNSQIAIEAVRRAGTPDDDPFFAKAMHFLVRNQNLSEERRFTWRRAGGGTLISGNDGGATYMPGSSHAGEDHLGDGIWRARSYGSMTWVLTKSYLLCGLQPDDRRVTAALRWLADRFTVEDNPGFADPRDAAAGLYYQHLAMARTLAMIPAGRFQDREGRPIPWRETLLRKLVDEQRTDGSWFNDRSARWWEDSPTLCTGYAVLALKAAGA